MRRRRVDSSIEKLLVSAMVVSDPFLAYSSGRIDVTLLQSPHLKRLASWCLEYYERHNKAPRETIESIFFSWVEKADRSGPEVDALHAVLNELSGKFHTVESLNVPYLQDQLGEYMAGKRLSRLADRVQGALESGKVAEALNEVNGFKGVGVESESGVDPLNDADVWEEVFADYQEPLVKFPGDAGKFLNQACTRDSLIGIQAPEKRGKTFWALEFVIQALRQRRRVALFEVGDLSRAQILRRLAVRVSGRPMWQSQCGDLRVPIRLIIHPGNERPDRKYTTITCKEPISLDQSRKAMKEFMRRNGLGVGGVPHLMVSVHANSSLSVGGIEGVLTGWEVNKGFVPDVIVIDYADILIAEDSKEDKRHQVNEIWSALRRLSQEYRCLVVAPTQADAGSYDVKTQTIHNYSEDKRKMAHVTGMLGLNQTDTDKREGLMRLNWIVLRENTFQPRRCLWVAYAFELSKAICCSVLDNYRGKQRAPRGEE